MSQLVVDYSIIIPAYNEAKRIAKTLNQAVKFFSSKQEGWEIIVVDDGSTDSTRQVVEALQLPNVRVVDYGHNGGKGFAVAYGMSVAKGQWLLMADADNSTPIEQFDNLHRYAGEYEVIIGSRYVKGAHVIVKQTLARRLFSRLGNILVQALILPGLRDTQCGFKLFSAEAAKRIFPRQTITGWGFDMEVLHIARLYGYQIKEVPINWYNDEQSRLQSGRVFSRTLKELLIIRWNSWVGRYRLSDQPVNS